MPPLNKYEKHSHQPHWNEVKPSESEKPVFQAIFLFLLFKSSSLMSFSLITYRQSVYLLWNAPETSCEMCFIYMSVLLLRAVFTFYRLFVDNLLCVPGFISKSDSIALRHGIYWDGSSVWTIFFSSSFCCYLQKLEIKLLK